MKVTEVTRAELAHMYETMKVKDICAQLGGIQAPRLYALLDAAGIPRKRDQKAKVRLVG